MRVFGVMILALTLAACLGCESPAPQGSTERFDATPPPPEPEAPVGDPAPAEGAAQPAAPEAPADAAAADNPDAATPAPAAAPGEPPAGATTEPAPENPPTEGEGLTEAKVGVGAKGKDYGGPGFITTPVETMFRIEERIDFEAQIPKAMQIYKAAHNDKGPKTNEEFMTVIIKEHGVKLPVLAEGSTYWYDAKTEKLMVRSPKAP